jgi:type II secretory pathway pseudopilin PulG
MTVPGNDLNSPFSRRACSPPAKRHAFTLIEVTISVALAVVLMLGIAQVFRIVGDTVGTGQVLASAQRDSRAAQAVMANDFNTAVSDGAPFMMMDSLQEWAFRNQADMLGDKDGLPETSDPLGTGTESPQSPTIYNYRSHRKDDFTFFGRGSFARQTGADVPSSGSSPFISNMGSTEAMLWYGLLNIADNSGNFPPSGSGNNVTPGRGPFSTNPNNYFATSWILGRQQILLQERTGLANNNTQLTSTPGSTSGTPVSEIVDQSTNWNGQGTPQYAYMQTAGVALSPLACGSIAYPSSGSGGSLLLATQGIPATLLSGRIDLAATSISGYRNILSTYIAANPNLNWWTNVPGGSPNGQTSRFQAQPFFLTKPPTPESMAYQAPIFVRGCTQFIVEYAGDYLNQEPVAGKVTDTYVHVSGNQPNLTITAGSTDGQIDYVPVSGSGQSMVRKIRWYGFPRSTSNTPGTAPNPVSISAANGDVVPLRDLWATATNGSQGPAAPFERVLPSTTAQPDYAPVGSLSNTAQYTCAWGPNDPKPKMIRITLTIDDPGGRLGDGQTYEYIYTLP